MWKRFTNEKIQENNRNEHHGKQEEQSRHNLVLPALGELRRKNGQEKSEYDQLAVKQRTVSI
jgi:hypothetical protein